MNARDAEGKYHKVSLVKRPATLAFCDTVIWSQRGDRMPRAPKPVRGVYEREPGNWCGRYRTPSGQLVRKSFGPDRQAAVRWVEKARTIRVTGDGVLPETATRHPRTFAELDRIGSEVTVGELGDDLLRHLRGRPEEYKDQINPPRYVADIKAAFGELPAASLRPRQIVEWLDSVKAERNLAPATLNKLKATLSAMYREGILNDKVTTNPARSVKQRKPPAELPRFLTAEEERRLRAVLQTDIEAAADRPQYQKHMVHRVCELDVALGTGMRKGEQYGLRWPDVDFGRRVIVLADTKNGRPREVYMNNDVLAAMRTLRGLDLKRKDRAGDRPNQSPTDSVFAVSDNKSWWQSALQRAKIRNFRWHDLRHTFCSRLAQNGASLKLLQEAAGHQTIQMAARYAHLSPSNVRTAVDCLSRL